ncbi:MAG: histidine phosphatase family protein [Pararhodobacter sp.]|nr:histidine phosphatase family protein [Pararhodobacter sp.]
MTKRLILIRHAKSSWDDPLMSDHDRPLNARGRQAAADLGQWLASRGYVPGEVLCSDATRTLETWTGIAGALPEGPTLVLKPALYHASPDVMLAVLRHAQADCVMMIGHNPGIGEFAERIVAQMPGHPAYRRYPTGATLVASFEIDHWQDVAFGQGAARDFIVPRELAA